MYIILQLLGEIISSLWAHPLANGRAGAGPAYIFINEIGSNLNCKSYLEFFHEGGFDDEALLGLFLGILILQPDVRKKKNNIIAMFDLKIIRDLPKDTKFFVLGNPEDNWIPDAENYYGASFGNLHEAETFASPVSNNTFFQIVLARCPLLPIKYLEPFLIGYKLTKIR